METIVLLFKIFEALLLAFLFLASLYFLVFAVAGKFYKERKKHFARRKARVAVLIPAYKEDAVIVQTAKSAVGHISKAAQCQVWVIADGLKPETLQLLYKTGANVLTVAFESSTKAKSLNRALASLTQGFDYAIVLDADNIMKVGFVDELVGKLNEGYPVVQGHRTAKNTNTSIATLDALSEEVNNNIFRKGHRVLGFSSALIGSGFGCQFKLFKTLMGRIEAVGGFDKELELSILEKRLTIAYAEKAVVYDEKVQQPEAFVNQRRRWLSAQFVYLGRNFGNGFKQLLRGNFDYFDKFFQFVLPPRILALGISALFSLGYAIILDFTGSVPYSGVWWFVTLAVSSFSILISIPAKIYRMDLIGSVLTLPNGFFLTVFALLKVRGANKKFIHTVHSSAS